MSFSLNSSLSANSTVTLHLIFWNQTPPMAHPFPILCHACGSHALGLWSFQSEDNSLWQLDGLQCPGQLGLPRLAASAWKALDGMLTVPRPSESGSGRDSGANKESCHHLHWQQWEGLGAWQAYEQAVPKPCLSIVLTASAAPTVACSKTHHLLNLSSWLPLCHHHSSFKWPGKLQSPALASMAPGHRPDPSFLKLPCVCSLLPLLPLSHSLACLQAMPLFDLGTWS
jgi:hypothetical protein